MQWSLQVDGKDLFRLDGNNYYPEKGHTLPEESQRINIDQCWLRYERQTLKVLPETKAIVFCVRLYMTSLRDIVCEGNGVELADVIDSMLEKLGHYTKRSRTSPLLSKLRHLNMPSLSIFTGSVVCLLLSLQWGGTTDDATIPRSVILNRTVGPCLLYAFCSSAAFNVIDYFLPIWFQAIKGATAAKSGQMLLLSIIGLSVAAISSGFIFSAIGYYTPLLLLGSTMMATGFGFLTSFTPSTTHTAWIGWQNVLTNLLREGLQAAAIPGLDVGGVIEQGATGFLRHAAADQKALVIFWAGVAAACVGLVAALGMNWNSVKGKKKSEGEEDRDGDEEEVA
ncbi:hypothetical protein BDV12DRAFT_203095 [Aspergillus spectabilis]